MTVWKTNLGVDSGMMSVVPCPKDAVLGRGTLVVPAKNGVPYRAKVSIHNFGSVFRDRVGLLTLERMDKLATQGTDVVTHEGGLVIGDPCYTGWLDTGEGRKSRELHCKGTNEPILIDTPRGRAVTVGSGIGDGTYQCRVAFDDDGLAKSIEVDFVGDHEHMVMLLRVYRVMLAEVVDDDDEDLDREEWDERAKELMRHTDDFLNEMFEDAEWK